MQHYTVILSGNCSTCFEWKLVVGTGLSVLWVAYATHSTLKPVPTLPR